MARLDEEDVETLHDARGPVAVAKPVTGAEGLPMPTLLLVGGDGALRSRLAAELPEFQVRLEQLPNDPSQAPDIILAALPLDVAGRAILKALPSTGRPPVVALIQAREEPILRLVAPALDEVVLWEGAGILPTDLARQLLRRVEIARRPEAVAPASRAAAQPDSFEETLITRPNVRAPQPPLVVNAPASVDLADLIDDVVIELDASCRVLAANAAACRLAKLSRTEILGRSCSEVLPSGEGCGAQPCVARRAREQQHDTWLERERDDRAVQVLATPRPDGSVIVREADVTNLRQLQRQLAKSLDSLEQVNAELIARASCLERVVQASTDLKSATTPEELA